MINNNDLFSEFDTWNAIHYFAFKHRKKYPNLFFCYFSHTGRVIEEFSTKDKSSIISLLQEYKQKLNGHWGFLSLFTSNKSGFEVYNFFSKTEFFNSNISQLIFQDAIPVNEETKV